MARPWPEEQSLWKLAYQRGGRGQARGRCTMLHRNMFLKIYNTPLKINMEHNHGGLEDHFPF